MLAGTDRADTTPYGGVGELRQMYRCSRRVGQQTCNVNHCPGNRSTRCRADGVEEQCWAKSCAHLTAFEPHVVDWRDRCFIRRQLHTEPCNTHGPGLQFEH